MAKNEKALKALDIPIVKLRPRNERSVGAKSIKRIEASLKAVGLIEPLIVYPQGDYYEILDGCLRYRILLDMGVETLPCLIWDKREAFTGNRMVNRLSPKQEMRMLRKSLEELDEQTIADALGMAGIKHRLNTGLLQKLAPAVVDAFEENKLNYSCVKELSYVKTERQLEILKLMESCNDYSLMFARGMVIKTPPAKRAKPNGVRTPWDKTSDNKSDLLKKLQQVERKQEFFSGLYRQYTANLLKLVIYVRSLVTNDIIKAYLDNKYPEQVRIIEQIIELTER